MSEQETTGRPWHLWVVAILTLLWNAIGCLDFIMTQMENADYFENAGFTSEQMAFFTGYPTWAALIWGVAVFSPMLGALCLLLKTRLAFACFVVGLLTYVIAMTRQYGFTEFMTLFPEPSYPIFSVIIFVIGLGQVLYARAMTSRRVLQ